MFYNTGIATYVWVLSNKKTAERKGKVQLINAADLSSKMRKSLGSKRNYLTDDDIKTITQCFGDFEAVEPIALDKPAEQKSNRGRQAANSKAEALKTFASKIFHSHQFGYRRLTIERPLRLSAQFTDAAIESLRFAPKPYNAAMQAVYQRFANEWAGDGSGGDKYGDLSGVEVEVRALVKAEFPELKEKQIKELLGRKLWLAQQQLLHKAQALQSIIGTAQSDDFNTFEDSLKAALKQADVKLDTKEKKQLLDAITCKNPDAEPVIKKELKKAHKTPASPLYGLFDYQGKVVEFQPDGDLRDNENVPLDPSVATSELIESYFTREVQPHVLDAWINADKRDDKDGEIGIVGYEIPFNRHFYVYQPPRPLEEIDADLDKVSAEIMQLLGEVHS